MNYYEKYRKGVIEKHIAKNGRLLQDVMLDENKNPVVVNNMIVGGGDNPFLYGGLLMATFSMEAMKGVNRSFEYATKLLEYFLLVEKERPSDKNNFFTRRKNWWKGQKDLSKDELCGIVLGLHYYIKASNQLKELVHRDIAFDFMLRLASYLRHKGYKPSGAWVFEYPFGCIFQYHSGHLSDNFKPRWFSKLVFYTAMFGLPLIYRGARLLKTKPNFFNVALFLHCSLMLIETKKTSWLEKVLSWFYNYFANGDGLHNAYLEVIAKMAGVENAMDIRFSNVIRPEGVFTDGLPTIELKDKWEKSNNNLIGECFTWEHSNTAGHQLKYWWDRALYRLGPASKDQLGDGKYYVESCGLGLLFVRALLGYKELSEMPVLESNEKYETLSYDGAY